MRLLQLFEQQSEFEEQAASFCKQVIVCVGRGFAGVPLGRGVGACVGAKVVGTGVGAGVGKGTVTIVSLEEFGTSANNLVNAEVLILAGSTI